MTISSCSSCSDTPKNYLTQLRERHEQSLKTPDIAQPEKKVNTVPQADASGRIDFVV